MKSSLPVFTRNNPFHSASKVGKSHYHPSSNQSLTKKKQKTALSPVRLRQQSTSDVHTLSPKGKHSPKKRDNGLVTTVGQPEYEDVWPSTDLGSSPASSTTSSDIDIPEQTRKSTVSFRLEDKEDSMLAKYIERFRHGRPQSREERQVMAMAKGEEQLPFWWMSPSSSTPTKTTDEDVILSLKDEHGSAIFSPAVEHQSTRHLSPCRKSLSDDFDGTEILHLQERASTLLLRGESALSDESVPVSSEGLGCSDFSSPVTVDEPMQRPLIPSLIKSTAVNADSATARATASTNFAMRSMINAARPEEDILFQWRLRRKMEQAREQPQSVQHYSLHGATTSWQAPSLSHYSASGKEYKQQQSTGPSKVFQKATHPHVTSPHPETKDAEGPFPPVSNPPSFQNTVFSGSSASQPQTIAHVPAHMHLLCDVLPCPIQSSHVHKRQSISQTLGEPKLVHKKTQVHRNLTEEPTLEPGSSSPPASSGAVDGVIKMLGHHKRQGRKRKEKVQTDNTQEKKSAPKSRSSVGSDLSDGHGSTYSSSHQRLHKKVIPRTRPHEQQGAHDFATENCTVDHAPPPSLIHSTLGQVVSEVLFPTVDSSPAQKTPVSLAASSTALTPPQSTVPPHSAQNSVEVISQLLQEAEDSDEKEFEDDPLLQVLRKQRKWVKNQISEVELLLSELEEQQVT